MKPFPIFVAVVTLCAAVFAISWISQPPSVELPLIDEAGWASENPFAIPKAGPHPRAVLEEDSYDFGKMILGETGSHAFVIRNEGDAPLKLHKGSITCKCTIPSIPEEEIPPGESAEVVMEWRPFDPTDSFDKWAMIWTNDPENEELRITITGEVRRLVGVIPPPPWTINNVSEAGDSEFHGTIASGRNSFNILGVEASNDWLTADLKPLTEEELAELGDDYSSGYSVHGKIQPGMSVGRFHAKLVIPTDLGDGHAVGINIDGTRPGPFSILGAAWYGADMTVRMGSVPVGQGKSVTLSLFVNREDDPIVLESFTADPDVVEVSLERDEAFPSPVKEKYLLTFTLSPETPAGIYKDATRINLQATTNREGMADLSFSVEATVE